ncbi:MAG: alpha/beta hydrolase [Hydrogenophaga sp.]|jgi:pimeloyl-ACP methyl ester carboxylesterase|nr:alpha/beta hydrolase [Hydrogenophaga sp.]
MSHALTPRLRAWQETGEFLKYRGQRVFVRRAGSGPVLLLVHGYPTGSYDWHRVWDALAATHTVVAVDMLGLGFSDKPLHHPYRIADHADLHDWLLGHLGIRECTLVAHDLGVTVAQELLARRAEHAGLPQVERLVLLNGGVVPEAYRPRTIQRVLASPLGGWVGPRIGRIAFEVSLQPLFTPEHLPTRALLDDLWALLTHNDGLEVAHRVGRFWRERLAFSERLLRPLVEGQVPVLLVNGAKDPNSGWHMVQHTLQRVPGAEVVRLDDAGHWPQFDQPEVVVEQIVRFGQRSLETA